METPPSPPAPPPSNPTPPPPVPPSTAPRGWWSRNWKWFVPTGCLTVLFLFLMFVFGIIAIVFGAMKSSDVYKMAYQRAKNDRRVVEALGQPIRDGWIVAGKTEVSGSSGQSDTSFSIRGPRGGATVYAVATKSEGEWQYSKLRVRIDKTSETIDLLEEGVE